MLISADVVDALPRERTQYVDDQPYRGREYIGSAPKVGSDSYGKTVTGDGSPQAYLVMQPPHSTTRPHFHGTNQFQVFVGGTGSVGKLRTDPVTVQYAGAHTPYGPIQAEDDGIAYFTLRREWDSGAKYLPAQKEQLTKGQQRQVVGGLNGAAANATTTLIHETEDGLFAKFFKLSPGEKATLPSAMDGDGQYHVVIKGSLIRDGKALGPNSIEFAYREAGPVEIKAGEDGLELVLARFPKNSSN